MTIIEHEQFERLRASRRAFEASDRQRGRRAGKAWALNDAEWEDLKFTCETFAPKTAEPADLIAGLESAGYPRRDVLARFGVVMPGAITPAMTRGFLEAAAEIFEELSTE